MPFQEDCHEEEEQILLELEIMSSNSNSKNRASGRRGENHAQYKQMKSSPGLRGKAARRSSRRCSSSSRSLNRGNCYSLHNSRSRRNNSRSSCSLHNNSRKSSNHSRSLNKDSSHRLYNNSRRISSHSSCKKGRIRNNYRRGRGARRQQQYQQKREQLQPQQ